MLSGFASGCSSGAHEEMMLGFIPAYEGMRAILPIRPAIGCGNQFWVFGADQQIQQILWIEEGSFRQVSVVFNPLRSQHSVFAEPNGTWNTIGDIDVFEPTFELTSVAGKTVYGTFDASAEFPEAYGDLQQLSLWVVNGLERYSTTRPDTFRKTEAVCDVTLTNAGSVRTVTLSLNGKTLATGSRTGNGSITLVESNSSGVSGSVSVTYSADVTSGCTLTKRYAASYTIDLTLSGVLILNSLNQQVYNSDGNPMYHS